jgi:hypothetical protein
MITPPTDCFYVVRVEGEAVEYVASALSAAVASDILDAVLISTDFKNDIQATLALDKTVDDVKTRLIDDFTEFTTLNPLYIPSSAEEIEEALDGDETTENMRFVGMDGSPFTIKVVSVSANDRDIIAGKLACRPFDLPPYSELIKAHSDIKLN